MTDVRRDRLTIKPESREDLSHISESPQPKQQRVSRFGNGGDAQPEIGRFRPPWKQGNTWESCLITGGESGIGRAICTVLWDKPSL